MKASCQGSGPSILTGGPYINLQGSPQAVHGSVGCQSYTAGISHP